MKAFLLVFALAVTSCWGQRLPGLQMVKPDPSTNRPLLVMSPCDNDDPWQIPIEVYSEKDFSLFVDQPCINAAVNLGFGQTGKFFVGLWSFYKNSDYPCKVLFGPELSKKIAADAEMSRECKTITYRLRWFSVDTRENKFSVTRSIFLDENGALYMQTKAAPEWRSISVLPPDVATSYRKSIAEITRRIEKLQQYVDSINGKQDHH